MEVVGIEEIAEVIVCTKNKTLKTKFNNVMIKTLKAGIKGTHLNIIKYIYDKPTGLPQWLSGKESTCNAGDTGDISLIPGSGRSPGGAWQPTPVFLPGEFHGQSSLADYSPQGRKESDMTEAN